MNTTAVPLNDDRLLSPRELSELIGLNEKAIRAAMRNGLRHVAIGTGRRQFCRTKMPWVREWLDTVEQSAQLSRRANEILQNPPRKRSGARYQDHR